MCRFGSMKRVFTRQTPGFGDDPVLRYGGVGLHVSGPGGKTSCATEQTIGRG